MDAALLEGAPKVERASGFTDVLVVGVSDFHEVAKYFVQGHGG